jgi:hypothetical protein
MWYNIYNLLNIHAPTTCLPSAPGGKKAMIMKTRFCHSPAPGIALLLLLACWMYPVRSCFATGPPEIIPVSIAATAYWDETVKDDDGEELQQYTGSFLMFVNGTMTFDPEGSPVVSRQGTMVMPAESYVPDALSFWCVYNEEVYDLREDYIDKCPDNLLARYHGSNGGTITDGPRLVIANFSSAAAPFMENLSEQEKQFAAQLQSQLGKQMPDWYQFAVGGGTPGALPREVKVKGIRAKGPPDCDFEDTEKGFPGFLLGMQMQLPPGGTMTGYRRWQADCDGCFPPSFGLSVSDMTEFGGEEPLDPPEGGKKNVTYTLSWYLGVVPAPVTTGPEEEEKDDDCEKLKKDLAFISLKMAAYSNKSIREYCKSLDCDASTQKNIYQDSVEKAVMDAINNNKDNYMDQLQDVVDAKGENAAPPWEPDWTEQPEDPDEPLCPSESLDKQTAKADMKTTPWDSEDGTLNNFGQPLGGTKITDFCTGGVTVQTTDGNGKVTLGDLQTVMECWEEASGSKEVGDARFESKLEHERIHVKDYVVKGPTKDVDELGDRELKATQKELDVLRDKMHKMGCL